MRKLAVAVAVLAFLGLGVKNSNAEAQQVVAVAASSTPMTGAYITGGFIGVVAALCIYDLYLKINHLKNWDGTPIKGKTPSFPW